jgi:nicotinamide mononucleotide transporter
MMSIWEIIAVVMGISYVTLAMRENSWCWPAGFISTSIFCVLFFKAKLYMESGLQIYYTSMAVYGWWQWQYGGKDKHSLPISRWPLQSHVLALSAIIILSGISGILLANNTQATYPVLDSIVTWGSLIATYMMARKILENWLYWVALDSLALCLYFNKGLYFTTGLFCLYVVLAMLGFYRWLKTSRGQALVGSNASEVDSALRANAPPLNTNS